MEGHLCVLRTGKMDATLVYWPQKRNALLARAICQQTCLCANKARRRSQVTSTRQNCCCAFVECVNWLADANRIIVGIFYTGYNPQAEHNPSRMLDYEQSAEVVGAVSWKAIVRITRNVRWPCQAIEDIHIYLLYVL